MPKGYVIFTEQVNDGDTMDEYRQEALPSVLGSGGAPLAAGAPSEVLEGEWHGNQTVILEFASVEAARRWYDSPDYQAIIGKRHAAATSNAIILAGFEMPEG